MNSLIKHKNTKRSNIMSQVFGIYENNFILNSNPAKKSMLTIKPAFGIRMINDSV